VFNVVTITCDEKAVFNGMKTPIYKIAFTWPDPTENLGIYFLTSSKGLSLRTNFLVAGPEGSGLPHGVTVNQFHPNRTHSNWSQKTSLNVALLSWGRQFFKVSNQIIHASPVFNADWKWGIHLIQGSAAQKNYCIIYLPLLIAFYFVCTRFHYDRRWTLRKTYVIVRPASQQLTLICNKQITRLI
jgi:hypothetical protein